MLSRRLTVPPVGRKVDSLVHTDFCQGRRPRGNRSQNRSQSGIVNGWGPIRSFSFLFYCVKKLDFTSTGYRVFLQVFVGRNRRAHFCVSHIS